MSLSILPFSLQLPAGYSFTTDNPATQDASVSSTTPASAVATSTTPATSSAPVDVISISNALVAGNFTVQAGDSYRMGGLFKAGAASGQTIAGYRVALGDGGGTGGQLWLAGNNVTGQTDFTTDEFAQLTYVTGTAGSQSLTVVAQTGTRLANGTLTREIDSPAVQIAANVTGTRSINAMNALATQLAATDPDADIASIAQQAGIFTGWSGAAQPTLQTAGNFTAQAGDSYRMGGLFKAGAASGQTIAGYRVALGDGDGTGGQLWLAGNNVTGQTDFTADEFAQLTYVTGTAGSQSLTVVAQTGTRLANGTLTREIDSPAVQIAANVTGTRSINAMNALATQLAATDPDADIASIAQQAGIFTGWSGAAQPTLQTDGNFTAQAGDSYRMVGLFKAGAAAGQTIAGYRVALGDGDGTGGQLWLAGNNVTGQTDFTADEFAQLTYVTGTAGSQSLTVVAQTGTRLANGTLTREIDSPAVQIAANVTGTRSINAMNALATQLAATDPDADIASIAQQAGIFTGWSGAAQPTLQTDGNFTAQAGDSYRMVGLFKAGAASGQTIAGYRVALGDGGGTGGQLWLAGNNVTGQTDFTADEFAQLTYVAGTAGSQSLTVVAQTGTRLANGTLTREIDSPAVQIAANVTGTRSINAMNALATQLAATDPDADIASIAQQAGIFTGWSGAAQPTLQTALAVEPPVSLGALEATAGAYQSAGSNTSQPATDLSSFYPTAIASAESPGNFASPGGPVATALLLLGGVAVGAFQTVDDLTAQALAIRAYNTTKIL